MTCNRPFGSYRPGEPFRDYPFVPDATDVAEVRGQMQLDKILPRR
jgi:biotin synthase